MAERTPPKWLTIGALGLIVALALVVRLIVGSQIPLDADESVEAITAIHILHGHFALMESNARYLGALDSYILVPFIALFGTTVTTIRIAFAIVGAALIGLMFALGRVAFRRAREALLMAGIAAVFPLFPLAYGVEARARGRRIPCRPIRRFARSSRSRCRSSSAPASSTAARRSQRRRRSMSGCCSWQWPRSGIAVRAWPCGCVVAPRRPDRSTSAS